MLICVWIGYYTNLVSDIQVIINTITIKIKITIAYFGEVIYNNDIEVVKSGAKW